LPGRDQLSARVAQRELVRAHARRDYWVRSGG
jgi:hypothetical protein